MSVCTDGASSIKGRNEEFVAILQKALPMSNALISFVLSYISKINLLNLL